MVLADTLLTYRFSRRRSVGSEPFVLDITCRSLHLIFKDSGDPRFGKARVRVDGVWERVLDPREAGWTHCHATLLFREERSAAHRVEIAMEPEDEGKLFTILGFGYVL